MAVEALVQQLHEHALRPAAEVGAQPVGEQQRRPGRDGSRETRGGLPDGEADGGETFLWLRFGIGLLLPIVVGGVTYTCVMQVRLDRLAALLQVLL